MKKSPLWVAVCASALSFIALPSYAQLIPVLGGQAYYDDVANLTWLANANAAVGSAYDTYVPGTGVMTWADANAWVASLDINGVTGWRLPDTLQPDSSCGSQTFGSSGYNCTGSELGNLFYNVLGGTAGISIDTSHNSNYDLFTNVQSPYWSATEYAPITSDAWVFNMGSGGQRAVSKADEGVHAWAVYSGNAGAVPLPAAVWLFGSGLLGLIGIGGRKSN